MERIEELDETSDIQAVVAAVRNRADEIRGNLGPKNLWEERVERADELMEIADRIEASVKRERDLASLRAIHAVEMAERDARREPVPVVSRETQSVAHNAACVCQTAHDTAKVREALSAAGRAAREIQKVTEEADTAEVAISIAEICERALLFPLRNCDVGTAEEQDERFTRFCRSRSRQFKSCKGCPICDAEPIACALTWGQMPYEAEKEGGRP